MCTLTWWRDGPRYALFFNRDELTTRLPAEPPAIRTADNGTRFIAPIDGNRSGTWIFANEHGLTVALLNYYDADTNHDPATLAPSRGQLVLALAGACDVPAVAAALATMPLEGYPPFHLFALATAAEPRLWTWSGAGTPLHLTENPEQPITTSSFDASSVCTRRRQRYREATASGVTPGVLYDFHHSTDPHTSAYSVRMRRPGAQTVSFSRVDCGDSEIRFTYRDEKTGSFELSDAVTVMLPLT